MANKKFQTADIAIAEINSRVELIKSLLPAELLAEKYNALIDENAADYIAQIEADRNFKFPNFDYIVGNFGYGCSLRSVVKKSISDTVVHYGALLKSHKKLAN
jgi:hypothetical protein